MRVSRYGGWSGSEWEGSGRVGGGVGEWEWESGSGSGLRRARTIVCFI